MTRRVAYHLQQIGKPQADGKELVDILLGAFIDARWFGSSLAFKKEGGRDADAEADQEQAVASTSRASKKKGDTGAREWKPEPKTLTGAVQFNMGECLHEAEEIQIQGTSIFASTAEKAQGTFTSYAALRYGLFAFNGVANEHSARRSRMTDGDYETLLTALWNGVRSAGNTRTKMGQVPRLLVSVEYHSGEEFQFGNLIDYVGTLGADDRLASHWASPDDYRLDISRLLERLAGQQARIARVRYELSPDIRFAGPGIPLDWVALGLDTPAAG